MMGPVPIAIAGGPAAAAEMAIPPALRNYPGNKGADGVYQKIIGLMPPHEVYIEAFVGGGAVFRNKRPARSSIVIDADADVAGMWKKMNPPSTSVIHGDARSLLPLLVPEANGLGRVLVYADPPYVMETRRSARPIYRHEFTDADHIGLLRVLRALPCCVILSGYRSDLYDAELGGWQRMDFNAATHRGPVVESVWFNFPVTALHDWRYVGANFRERERIKRKTARWRAKLEKMPELERAALLAALSELESPEMARGSIAAVNVGNGDARSGSANSGEAVPE